MTAHLPTQPEPFQSMGPPKTVLLTGGTGFIGSRLVSRLVAEGWQVHVLIRPTSNLDLLSRIQPHIQLHSFHGDTGELVSLLAIIRPTLVYHLASLFIARHITSDVLPLIQSNISFPTQLLESMAVNDVRYLVNTGTAWQHYDSNDYHPVCLYAATKQAFEAILQYYVETTSLHVTTMKLFDTYGPGDPRPKLFSLLRQALQHQQRLEMSPGEQEIDLVYIDDVVEAFILAGQRLLSGRAQKSEEYAISSRTVLTLREVVTRYLEMAGRPVEVAWGARPYRPREVMTTWKGGISLPGWNPSVPLDLGLQRMVEEALRD